jgi:hypothetical protein
MARRPLDARGTVRLNSTLDVPTYDRLVKVAYIRGLSLSAVVRAALVKHLRDETVELVAERVASRRAARAVVDALSADSVTHNDAVTHNDPTL